MMKTKPVATTLLVIMAIIFLIYIAATIHFGRYHAYLWAAMIGGLADWYAVTALYEAFKHSFQNGNLAAQ